VLGALRFYGKYYYNHEKETKGSCECQDLCLKHIGFVTSDDEEEENNNPYLRNMTLNHYEDI